MKLKLKDYKITFYLTFEDDYIKKDNIISQTIYCVINYNELICKIEKEKKSLEQYNYIVQDIKIEFLKGVF